MQDLWEDGVNSQTVLEHYGREMDVHAMRGFWKNDDSVLENLKKIPELLDAKEKIRITFDYDPDYPRALIQIRGFKKPYEYNLD